MKKTALIIIAAMLTLSLAACGNTANTTTTTAQPTAGETVTALATEPTSADLGEVPREEIGEPDIDIYYEGTETEALTSPPNIVVCTDDGEIATAGVCSPWGYEWSYPDGELMATAHADSKGGADMFGEASLATISYAETKGTASVQLIDTATLTSVKRWTREQSFDAEFSDNIITLINDGGEYVYQLEVTYSDSGAGFGTAYYYFILK